MTRTLALRLAAAALAPTLIATAQPALAVTAAPAKVTLDHISVVKLGSGPPVVLIPGLGSPRAAWDGVVPALARGHTVYLVQVNGFGGDAPGANLKPGILDGIVGDLHTYLTSEKAPPVRLVGHSMGGLAGLMFARAHPRQVERLMIVDALPYFPVLLAQGGPEPTKAQVAIVAAMMRDRVAARYGKPVDRAMIDADVAGLAVKAESRARSAEWAASADPRVTAQLLFEDMSNDLRPDLPELAMPITVITPWTEAGFGKERTAAFYRRQFAGGPISHSSTFPMPATWSCSTSPSVSLPRSPPSSNSSLGARPRLSPLVAVFHQSPAALKLSCPTAPRLARQRQCRFSSRSE